MVVKVRVSQAGIGKSEIFRQFRLVWHNSCHPNMWAIEYHRSHPRCTIRSIFKNSSGNRIRVHLRIYFDGQAGRFTVDIMFEREYYIYDISTVGVSNVFIYSSVYQLKIVGG